MKRKSMSIFAKSIFLAQNKEKNQRRFQKKNVASAFFSYVSKVIKKSKKKK